VFALVEKRRIPSPDGRYEIILRTDGQSAAEWPGSRLWVAGRAFIGRSFDWQGVWSPCSRYFAVMEWCSVNVQQMPEARLMVIDMEKSKECTLDRVEKGFVTPLRLYEGKVRYVRVDLSTKAREVLELPLDVSVPWTEVNCGRKDLPAAGR
jgi:hypothetical protein